MIQLINKISSKKWLIPAFLVILTITLLSLRKLSDPDLGFHLNTGRYIAENHAFPENDVFTFTSNQNKYIDLQWFFQILIYLTYKITSYNGLSIFVLILSCFILYIIYLRNKFFKIPLALNSILFLVSFLIIESRLVLRPEIFSYIYIILILLLLDKYYYLKKKNLYFLPVIMLFWVNMHSLFILGFILLAAYNLSVFYKEKKIDFYLLIFSVFSVFVCIVNPYFLKAFTFPVELLSRFNSGNIFNQHIKEFKSFFNAGLFNIKNLLFLIFLISVYISFILDYKKRKLHEIILLFTFTYLSLVTIRNIPLFVIVILPFFAGSLISLKKRFNIFFNNGIIKRLIFSGLILITSGLIMRIITNNYYFYNNSSYKTGLGIDSLEQPVKAIDFINKNQLNGKMLNSLGIGGWISWSSSQQVFIDGRLEVIKENLYKEVVESWNYNGLQKLIGKYKPSFIIYEYPKYISWTSRLSEMPDWRLLYLDGQIAVYAHNKFKTNIPELDFNNLLKNYDINRPFTESEITKILSKVQENKFNQWLSLFYKKKNYRETELLNIASFYTQTKQFEKAKMFFLKYLKTAPIKNKYADKALSEIFKITAKNTTLSDNIKTMSQTNNDIYKITNQSKDSVLKSPSENDIKISIEFFNSGNEKYAVKDIKGALQDYDKAIKLNSDYYKAYNNRGIIKASELQLFEEALADFNKAIEIKPDYSDAFLGRGSVKYSLKDYPGACSDWGTALKLGNKQAKIQIENYCNK